MHGRSRTARHCTCRKVPAASSNRRDHHTTHLSFFCPSSFSCPPLLLRLFPSRFSRWFQGAACLLSRVGWAERMRRVALTAPKREPSMKSSTCRSRSAHWRVRASTAACGKNNSVKIFEMLKQLLWNRFDKTWGLLFWVYNWLSCFQFVRMAGGVASSTGTGKCPQTTSGTEFSTSQRSK